MKLTNKNLSTAWENFFFSYIILWILLGVKKKSSAHLKKNFVLIISNKIQASIPFAKVQATDGFVG